jgi:O-antigen/teichoic acid export membrane protein
VVAVLATLGGLGALAGTGRGLPALAVGVMLGSLAGAGYGFTILGRRYGHWHGSWYGSWAGPADRTLARRMLREARPFWLAGSLTLVYARADVVLLDLLASDAEVGAYRMARQLVEVANQLPVLMLTALFPQLARAAPAPGAQLRRLENHVCLLLAVGGVAAGGLLAAASAPAVQLLLGPGFARSIPTLRVLAGAVPLMFVNAGLLHFFVARDRGSLNVTFAGAMVVVNVVANLLLGRRFGAVGGGLATLVTEAALSACCLYALVALRREGDVSAPRAR